MPIAALTRPRVVMGLMFFPRGGSAQVARGLAQVLAGQRWDVTIVSGSLRLPGRPGDAPLFFSGLTVSPINSTTPLSAASPLRAYSPMHPSHANPPRTPRIVLVHPPVPFNADAAGVGPGVPVAGHLHGTELLLLEAIASRPPVHWVHAEVWAQRMRRWASACQRLVVPSATQLTRAQELLQLDPDRYVQLPNGFDPGCFDRRPIDRTTLCRDLLLQRPCRPSPRPSPGPA